MLSASPEVDPLVPTAATAEVRGPRSLLASLATAGPATGGRRELVLQVAAAVLAVALLLGLLGALGYPVVDSLRAIWEGSVATDHGIEATLTESVPVIVTGVAAWFAYKAGLFNIGLDGQLQVGGIAAFVVVTGLPDLPGPVLVLAALMAGAIAGAAWALVAGWLKTARGASEVISTIMLNFIALSIGDQLISGALGDPGATSPQTERIPGSSEMGRVLPGLPVGWNFVIAVAVTAALIVLIRRTRTGLQLRAVGLNGEAAERAGLQVGRLQLMTFALSGAAAGLAGTMVVLGLRHLLAPGWAPAWGFKGILVAFLAVRVPALIPVWGVIFGALSVSGPALKAQASVPDGIVTVMQVLPVITLFLLYQVAGRITKGGVRR